MPQMYCATTWIIILGSYNPLMMSGILLLLGILPLLLIVFIVVMKVWIL